jgi:glycosyltransferase involved in cell wall biosynthesis
MMSSANADVSVIIPALNAADTIKRALESVAAQSVAPREVVVVDDGSDDGTCDIALGCARLLGSIELRIYRQNNLGAGAARNSALSKAAGTYVAFLDADDEWLPEKLERSLPYLDDPGIVLVAHNNLHIEAGRESINDSARRFNESRVPFVGLYRKGFIGTCTVVAKRHAVKAAGGLDPDLPAAQDFDLWLAMLADPAANFVVFGEVLSRYHVTAGSITSNTEQRLQCGQNIAERHARALGNYPGSMLASLAYRIAAIHYEAVKANLSNGRIGGAVLAALRFLYCLPKSIWVVLANRQTDRRNYFSAGGGPSASA